MNNKFSENLKKIRKDNNLSQEQLADELGVSRQAISKWESAVAYPEMDKIITLCDKFNLNIDDLLHKDIKEVKGEDEIKKKLNKYVDDFLNFITDTINMFSNMSFKTKCKCLFEQIVIGIVLTIVCLIIETLGHDLLYGIFGMLPEKIYFVLHSIIHLIYVVFAIMCSVVIFIHIFKTRYLDYYNKIKKDVVEEKTEVNDSDDVSKSSNKEDKLDKKNKILFKKNESKIIIRDPKHSEYKFINAIFKGIVGIIKFFTLCFAILLVAMLVFLFFGFAISFLVAKTGVFFLGLIITILAISVIDIICILLILNFVFNRKNDKKKMIWSFIISVITIGIGSGLIFLGSLDFEYVEKDKTMQKTESIEFKMRDGLFFESNYYIEYIESNIDNIKVEYTINKYCEIDYSDITSSNQIHLWSYCDNPIKMVKAIANNLGNKKIISITNEIDTLKIYASKDNINKIQNNREVYLNEMEQSQINSYEKRISELEEQNQEYLNKINEYEQEIVILESELFEYQLVE